MDNRFGTTDAKRLAISEFQIAGVLGFIVSVFRAFFLGYTKDIANGRKGTVRGRQITLAIERDCDIIGRRTDCELVNEVDPKICTVH